MREAVLAALKRDPELLPKVTGSLKDKLGEDGTMTKVVQAAEALEPIIQSAVQRKPSRLNKLGLKSATLLASLSEADEASNRKLANIAKNSTVGIVFVDVAGFTSYTAENGDEAASALLTSLTEAVAAAIKRSSGEIVKQLGDGFLLAFPSASQAIRGATQLRDNVERLRERGKIPDLHLRIAVHAGEPLVEHDDLLGHDVNLTARLLDHCRPGGVLVSDAAKELAGNRLKSVEFGKKKTVKIRGLAGRVDAYPVRSRAQAQRSSSS